MLKIYAILLLSLMVFLPVAQTGEAFFCCLDFRMPSLWSVWKFCLPLLVICGITLWVLQKESSTPDQSQRKEWVGIEVIWEGPDRVGIVMDQQGDNLYINYLNDRGGLSQVVKKVSEIRRKNCPL